MPKNKLNRRNKMNEKTIPYKKNPRMIIKQFKDKYILETAHIINPTGKAILDLIDGKNSVAVILSKLEKKYTSVKKEHLNKDVTAYILVLQKEGIIAFKNG
jgi:hypothetical protein